ncbi:MAG: hypothetical protein IPG18_12700 [Saprospiraceae bacterium]|nr:hypothetical protein [Saprospiraceae bacterium]
MTSVQNLLLPLNGNRVYLILIFLMWLGLGCSPKTTIPPSNKVVQQATKNIKDTVPEEIVQKYPDTLVWKNVSDQYPPIISPEEINIQEKVIPSYSKGEKVFLKKKYFLSLLIPLKSNQYTNSSLASNRFVQFYAGALLALEDLERNNLHLEINITDTEYPGFSAQKFMDSIDYTKTDLIIGPFEREDLKIVTGEALKKQITVISPWQTSTKIAKENDFYVQLKPNLKEHFIKITENVCSLYNRGEVTVITHNNQEGKAWFNYFSETAQKITGNKSYLNHFTVSEDSLQSPNTAFVRMFSTNPPKAVILPYYSYNDEEKLYSVVRRLSADKGKKEVVVYGMPLLHDSERIDYEYYSTLNVRIAISDFMDESKYEVKNFKKRYYDMFGEIAGHDAVKGYDVFMFIGKNLEEYGSKFQEHIISQRQNYLMSDFEIHKSVSDEEKSRVNIDFDFFENKQIQIIEFRDSGFKVID